MTLDTTSPTPDWALFIAESHVSSRHILARLPQPLRDEYEQTVGQLGAALVGDQRDLSLRRHFASWAAATVALAGNDSREREEFRSYLSDPELYPNGKQGLHGDTVRNLAVGRLREAVAERVEIAERALMDARSVEALLAAVDRGLCELCHARLAPEGHAGRETSLPLDGRDVCDRCVAATTESVKGYRSAPTKLTW